MVERLRGGSFSTIELRCDRNGGRRVAALYVVERLRGEVLTSELHDRKIRCHRNSRARVAALSGMAPARRGAHFGT